LRDWTNNLSQKEKGKESKESRGKEKIVKEADKVDKGITE
jgi:hypothetical protein